MREAWKGGRPKRGRRDLLLKWAGGKRQLLPELRRFYPDSFDRYIEPFVGSGAVFFDLQRSDRLGGRAALLVDTNPDLIGCYRMVRDRTEEVASWLERLANGHEARGATHYYEVRDQRFNPTRVRLREAGGGIEYTPELAAMMIYLNRTGFNGLFRVNSEGHFNVPAGRYARPSIADRDRLEGVALALRHPNVRIEYGPFVRALESARAGDFIYIDPPYEPLSRTASFTSYTAAGFGRAEQECLQALVVDAARRGCQVLLSNSTAVLVASLYIDDARARAAGLRAYRVPARRAINSVGSERGHVDEFLITNIDPRSPVPASVRGREASS